MFRAEGIISAYLTPGKPFSTRIGRDSLLKEIICLSNEPWSNTPGRTQQLITRLRNTKILYFSPAASLWDQSWHKPGRKVRPNVTVFTLPPVLMPDERFSHIFRMAQQRLGRFVQEKAERNRFRDALLWTTSPVHVHLLDHLEYTGLVYDCDREWDHLPGPWEGTLAHMADVVFAASPQLQERLSPCSANIALLPNGVNYTLFSGQTGAQKSNLTSRHSGSTLGWAGTIHADLDLGPLVYAAQRRPNWNFLLLGEKDAGNPWLGKLSQCPNVTITAPRPLMEVPEYLDQCDVLLNFLRTSQPYSDIIPARLYEYLSTGKPIVSMLWPDEVERFPDGIYGAYTEDGLLRLCAQALEEDRSWVDQRRRDYGAAAAWTNRAAEVSRILSTAGLL